MPAIVDVDFAVIGTAAVPEYAQEQFCWMHSSACCITWVSFTDMHNSLKRVQGHTVARTLPVILADVSALTAAHQPVQKLQEKLELLWRQSQEEARFLTLKL